MICNTILNMVENQQSLLFEDEELNSPKNLLEEYKDERDFVLEVIDFVEGWIAHTLQNYSVSITCEELVDKFTEKFGFTVRLYIWDIVQLLKSNESDTGSYARRYFGEDELKKVLWGKEEKQRAKDESTLDELFIKTFQHKSSKEFKEFIDFVSALREYSPFNNMLVRLQRPSAQYYATSSHWQKAFGRRVKPESIPIVILRPMGPVMLVFDVDDTEGKPLPPQILNPFSIKGEFNPELYQQTVANCEKVGIKVEEVPLSKSHAGTAIRQVSGDLIKLVVQINKNHNYGVKYASLCHELGHLFLGHLGGDPFGKEWVSRIGLSPKQREIEAESVSYILCKRAGIESNSDEYLAGYLNDSSDIRGVSIEAIMKTVTYIEQMQTKGFRPKTKPKKDT